MIKLRKSLILKKIEETSNRIVLPGFQGVPLGTVMRFFFKSLSKGIIFHRAAAMTYRVFFSIIPMFMALFAALSFFGERAQAIILNFIESVVPAYVWPAISEMITEVMRKQSGTVFYFSLFIGTFFLFISVNACINILNTTYFADTRRSFFRQLPIVFLIIIIWLTIIVLAIGVFIGASATFSYIDSHIFKSQHLLQTCLFIFKWLLLFFLVYMFISSFYYLAPAKIREYKLFSAGSTFATISMVLILGIMNFYFANFGNYNLIYGSLGALFAIQLWLYWNAMFILIGYDLNVSIAAAKKSHGNFLKS